MRVLQPVNSMAMLWCRLRVATNSSYTSSSTVLAVSTICCGPTPTFGLPPSELGSLCRGQHGFCRERTSAHAMGSADEFSLTPISTPRVSDPLVRSGCGSVEADKLHAVVRVIERWVAVPPETPLVCGSGTHRSHRETMYHSLPPLVRVLLRLGSRAPWVNCATACFQDVTEAPCSHPARTYQFFLASCSSRVV